MYLFHEQLKDLFYYEEYKMLFLKQLPLNAKNFFVSSRHLIVGERLLSVTLETVSFLTDKLVDFHYAIFSVSPSFLKV